MPKPGTGLAAAVGWNRVVTGRMHLAVERTGWPTRLGLSVGMAGFLALMAQVSFPLPWTPVPFSMMPFALLVAGACQKPVWSVLSVALYLAAGAVGLPVYAEGSSGVQHLVGSTAGYLFGFLLVSALVSAYVQRPRALLPHRLVVFLTAAVAVAVFAAASVVAWMARTGTGLEDAFGVGPSTLWVLAFVTAAGLGLTYVLLRRQRGQATEAANLWLVMLGALLVLHFCGVTVLWALTPLSLIQAIAVGSVVFLPFDIVKAGLAVALSLPFLPSPEPESVHA